MNADRGTKLYGLREKNLQIKNIYHENIFKKFISSLKKFG